MPTRAFCSVIAGSRSSISLPWDINRLVEPESRAAIVFNGDIYNYRELRTELESRGFVFCSESDTEVLFKGLRVLGRAVLDRLVGMFPLAIWDPHQRQLFLARDRAGEKPLYYASGSWGFAFASEIAGLTKLPGVDLSLDHDAVSLYLHYQYVPAPHTIYQGIRKLPPAHAMRVKITGIETWRYWDPIPLATGPRIEISRPDALAELERLFRVAVRGQMISDVPLGRSSRGNRLDCGRQYDVGMSSSQVRTFTIGFDIAAFNGIPACEPGGAASGRGSHHRAPDAE